MQLNKSKAGKVSWKTNSNNPLMMVKNICSKLFGRWNEQDLIIEKEWNSIWIMNFRLPGTGKKLVLKIEFPAKWFVWYKILSHKMSQKWAHISKEIQILYIEQVVQAPMDIVLFELSTKWFSTLLQKNQL